IRTKTGIKAPTAPIPVHPKEKPIPFRSRPHYSVFTVFVFRTAVSAQHAPHSHVSHLHSSHISPGHFHSSQAQVSHLAAFAQVQPSQTHCSHVHSPSAQRQFSHLHVSQVHSPFVQQAAALAQVQPSQTHCSHVHSPSAQRQFSHLHVSQVHSPCVQQAEASAATTSVSTTCAVATFFALRLPHEVITHAAAATIKRSANFFIVLKISKL